MTWHKLSTLASFSPATWSIIIIYHCLCIGICQHFGLMDLCVGTYNYGVSPLARLRHCLAEVQSLVFYLLHKTKNHTPLVLVFTLGCAESLDSKTYRSRIACGTLYMNCSKCFWGVFTFLGHTDSCEYFWSAAFQGVYIFAPRNIVCMKPASHLKFMKNREVYISHANCFEKHMLICWYFARYLLCVHSIHWMCKPHRIQTTSPPLYSDSWLQPPSHMHP